METLDSYQEYAQKAVEDFAKKDAAERFMLVDAIGDFEVKRVLDVGCGAGQQLLPFAEKTNALCIGIDVAEEVSKVAGGVFNESGFGNRGIFLQSLGEELPFANESFEVVMCRVSIPYMDNRRAISEISRVLKPNGYFFLKTHAPMFYFGMIKRRFLTFNPKQLAYPLICLTNGTLSLLTGKQPKGGIWKGKEVFQTRGFLKREFAKNNLKIIGELPDTNIQSDSFVIRKNLK